MREDMVKRLKNNIKSLSIYLNVIDMHWRLKSFLSLLLIIQVFVWNDEKWIKSTKIEKKT
jgi:hypothetical protein